MKMKSALLIVDVQNDFLPGGALGVAGGNEIIPVINSLVEDFWCHEEHVLACKDWHPANHSSFEAYGGPWPAHCVQGTKGAAFPFRLHQRLTVPPFYKGIEADKEAYSPFANEAFGQYLADHEINQLFITGLALDYCVKAAAIDAMKWGGRSPQTYMKAWVVLDATRPVSLYSDDALAEMDEEGVFFCYSAQVNTILAAEKPQEAPALV